MAKIKQWITHHLRIIQVGFTLTLCLILLFDMLLLSRTIKIDTIRNSLSSLSLLNLTRLIVLGCIAMLPAVLFDFVLVDLLNKNYKTSYIFTTGWISSTLSSLSLNGYFGVLSRSFFYNESSKKKQLFSSLSKIWIYSFSGLSMIASFSIIDVLFISNQPLLHNYLVWLIIALLIFPLLLVIAFLLNPNYFDNLTPKRQILLAISSTLKWIGLLVTFIYTGILLGISIDIFEIIPILIAAIIIGELSFLPAGIGPFGVSMI